MNLRVPSSTYLHEKLRLEVLIIYILNPKKFYIYYACKNDLQNYSAGKSGQTFHIISPSNIIKLNYMLYHITC